jgi:hypothetical protein
MAMLGDRSTAKLLAVAITVISRDVSRRSRPTVGTQGRVPPIDEMIHFEYRSVDQSSRLGRRSS